MTASLTVVMYHYVRDLRHSRYPEIKGLDRDAFEGQIQYLKRHCHIIGGQDLLAAVTDGAPLPPRPVLLTFDDGYADHFTEVFPILDREGLTGCFFPPARCILEHRVLDVNKLHFVLASVADKSVLVEFVQSQVERHRAAHGLLSPAEYWARLAKPNRFDPAEVIFVKRMLQRDLPLALRGEITDELFRRYVTTDEAAFSHELYMSIDQLAALQRHGMYVGSHGYDHFWLDALSPEDQTTEIDRSLQFLRQVAAPTDRWIMCYPYGAHNDALRATLRARGCAAALTTEVGLAQVGVHDPLALPRLDTNDLPKQADAPVSEWTTRADR